MQHTLTYLKKTEDTLAKLAASILKTSHTINNAKLIPKHILTKIPTPELTVKVMLESMGNNYVNQDHLRRIKQGLLTTKESVVILDSHTIRMDYKWLEICNNNESIAKLSWSNSGMGTFCITELNENYTSNKHRLCINKSKQKQLVVESVALNN